MNKILALLAVVIFASGCSTVGTVVGRVKPGDQKSEDYGVLDLSKTAPETWKKVEVAPEQDSFQGADKDPDASTTEISDVSYQSRKEGSIISINSACRKGRHHTSYTLRDFTQQLLMGITEVSYREEKPITVQKLPALETTIEGKMNLEPVKIRTTVVQREDCVFDLMYFARPDNFSAHAYDFEKFVASLRLK